jgi:parallel beta-helix repeat protein
VRARATESSNGLGLDRRSIAATAGAAVCVAVAIVMGGGTAQAAVFCGKTIVKDTTLKANLKNCPGDGLVIGAGDITLNLNGHKIDGQDAVGTEGVSISGHSGVHIKGGGGGRISEFPIGVSALTAAGVKLSGVEVSELSEGGVFLNTTTGATIKNDVISEAQIYGIQLSNSQGNEVSGNEITGPDSSAFGSPAIAVAGSDDSLITGNILRGGGEGDWGITVHGSAERTKVKANEVRAFSQSGIDVYDGALDTHVKKNKAIGNHSDGILVDGDAGIGTDVINNLARKNDDDGIELDHANVRVGDNRALDNGDWGIIATELIVDLGGNTASGNLQGAQCSGISCN